ncbi:MAG: uracil phosphoribosyltransferase [Bacteroidales bacterium]|nr:uracil phosphoribosyltransferase [Bacteroidales bacterium]MDD3200776.1 uracil phosphoribosyltransferase [Bacteroidales bacterium]
MKVINLGENNSVLNQYISEIRDKTIQKDNMRFRRNLERIGEIFAYEISKTLEYKTKEVETPLGIANCNVISDTIVLGTILRAGLPLHQGLLNVFDGAQNSFIAAYRKYGKDNKFNIQLEYASTPAIERKTLIIADTMLATGASMVLAYDRLIESGEPLHVHIVCPVACVTGIDYLAKNLPHKKVTLWVGTVDEELTNKSYIIPGLGDAGDLAYGSKI